MLRVGIDLGGSKIEIVALDTAGRELVRRRAPTPQGDYAGTLDAIAALVHGVEQELDACASVGIGTPGAVSQLTGRIKNSNSQWLLGQAFRCDLEALLEREVRIANDANCFALSEAIDGAGHGAHVVFGVILGTGVGGGIVIDGRVFEGANAIAGEWSHDPLPSPQAADLPLPACYCARAGCIETYLSGPGMMRDHLQATGVSIATGEIAARARAGDAACEATLARYEERLARALGAVINILDPDVIVLGGGLSNLDRLYENVPRLWTRYIFSDNVATRLARNAHGDSSGVRGAARLWNAACGA